MFKSSFLISCFLIGLFFVSLSQEQSSKKGGSKIKVLIIDGQNNHTNWRETTILMKGYLEETGLFDVEIATTPPVNGDMNNFRPDFTKYKVILSNYNGADWPDTTKKNFENFIKKGGGLVAIHAASNAFPNWIEYNKMIGLGGWGNRDEKSGPYVYYDEAQEKIIKDYSPGRAGAHGPEYPFQITIRNKTHPITKGMPSIWMHEKDELYSSLRGPAENMEVLATAFSRLDQRGTGRNEPIMMAIHYKKGRIFHTTLGHGTYSQKGIGFITVLQRGAEWVATGRVTQQIPVNFPAAEIGRNK